MKRYIYDWKKAYFFMQHGVLPLERPRVHFKTGAVFFVFDDKETEDVYNLWCKREGLKKLCEKERI